MSNEDRIRNRGRQTATVMAGREVGDSCREVAEYKSERHRDERAISTQAAGHSDEHDPRRDTSRGRSAPQVRLFGRVRTEPERHPRARDAVRGRR